MSNRRLSRKVALHGTNKAWTDRRQYPDFKRAYLSSLAAKQHGIALTYDLLIPKTLGQTFEDTITHARDNGFHALNITLPIKSELLNWPLFPVPKFYPWCRQHRHFQFSATGHNTDYTGFQKAILRREGRPAALSC